MLTKRLKEIYSLLPAVERFADVGCDHGYLTKAMLDGGKCSFATAADVSEKCLDKAKSLLKEYIDNGSCQAVVCDGLTLVDRCDLALIAGMGGEEIISILEKAPFLPEMLCLQPMKNAEKVREYVVYRGYKIQRDYVFLAQKKLYDLMLLVKGEDCLSEEEYLFGRDNVKNPGDAFRTRCKNRMKLIDSVLEDKNVNIDDKANLIEERERLKKYV